MLVGHNLGLNHGTTYSGGTRGRSIAESAFVDNGAAEPSGYNAYGSPVTLMGGGGTPDSDLTLPAKLINGWVDESSIVLLEPGGCSSAPCGPYYLQPLDAGGTFDPSAPVGVRVASEVEGRFFWVEHRTLLGTGSAAYICSASYSYTYGNGGLVRKTVMVDTATEGSTKAPEIYPMDAIELDVSADGSSFPLWVDVGVVDDQGFLPVTFSSSAPAPSPPLPPDPPAATRAATTRAARSWSSVTLFPPFIATYRVTRYSDFRRRAARAVRWAAAREGRNARTSASPTPPISCSTWRPTIITL